MMGNKAAEASYEEIAKKICGELYDLLTKPTIRELDDFPPELAGCEEFQQIYNHIGDLRDFSQHLQNGDLQVNVSGRGYIFSNMKALQASLRHLTWLAERVGEGDFSQRADYLGTLSEAFNEMTAKLRDSRMHLRRLSQIDELTQIPNRRALEVFLADHFAASQEQVRTMCIMMIDIDHFKEINDKYGHLGGDEILRQVSGLMKKQFRATDIFARYGGEEFIAVLPDSDLVAAQKAAQRTLEAVREAVFVLQAGDELTCTVSIGLAEIKPSDVSHSDMIARSDQAMYRAKRGGRNCIRVVK